MQLFWYCLHLLQVKLKTDKGTPLSHLQISLFLEFSSFQTGKIKQNKNTSSLSIPFSILVPSLIPLYLPLILVLQGSGLAEQANSLALCGWEKKKKSSKYTEIAFPPLSFLVHFLRKVPTHT